MTLGAAVSDFHGQANAWIDTELSMIEQTPAEPHAFREVRQLLEESVCRKNDVELHLQIVDSLGRILCGRSLC